MSTPRGPEIRRHRRHRPPGTALVALGAALCLTAWTGAGLVTAEQLPPGVSDAPPATAGPLTGTAGRPSVGGRPGCERHQAAVGRGPGGASGVVQQHVGGCRSAGPPARPAPAREPTRVRVPRIGVDSPLTVLGLDGTGALMPPADFDLAGWYGGGPAPGDPGPAVLAGHLDSRDGPAVFARVGELRAGDTVEVRRGGQWLSFRVTGSSRTRKDRFPTAAVYGPTPGPELRLITCGGDFDRRRRHYVDNVVVFAVAEPTR